MELNTKNVRTLALPRGKASKIYFDDDLPGFGLRLQGNSRSWVVQYGMAGKTRRMTLGSVAALDPGKARKLAKDLLARVRLGHDVASEKTEARAKQAETMGALLPRYMAHQRARLRPRSAEEVERHLHQHCRSLHPRPISSIDRRGVALLLAKIAESSGPSAANRVRASLSGWFGWLMREGLVENNPVANTNKAVEAGSRERVLQDSELGEIWRAAGDDHYGSIVKLLMLTGARRDEIASLRWSEIDLKEPLITLPGERTKNKRPHEIPLTPPALAIIKAQAQRLESDGSKRDLIFGFGNKGWQDWSGRKADLDVRILDARKQADPDAEAIADWRLHDFRRTLSTVMHERLGVQPHIVEAVLAHAGGHRAGVAGTYNRATYRTEKRRALELWADYVLAIVEGRKSKVTPLRSA